MSAETKRPGGRGAGEVTVPLSVISFHTRKNSRPRGPMALRALLTSQISNIDGCEYASFRPCKTFKMVHCKFRPFEGQIVTEGHQSTSRRCGRHKQHLQNMHIDTHLGSKIIAGAANDAGEEKKSRKLRLMLEIIPKP